MPISLFDAQHDISSSTKIPIPPDTIAAIITALQRFLSTCRDFEVPARNVQILATEATREAPNSEELCSRIRHAVEIDLKILSKEDEGKLGAIGIASSFSRDRDSLDQSSNALCVDLGGGSCQFTWLDAKSSFVHEDYDIVDVFDGDVSSAMECPRTISVPFGGAALLRRLELSPRGRTRADDGSFQEDLEERLRDSLAQIGLGGQEDLDLYFSGGGLRAYGHLLISYPDGTTGNSTYPITQLNGYSTSANHLVELLANLPSHDVLSRQPNISNRRATQIPATALLLRSLLAVLPTVRSVRFAQGGLREGALLSIPGRRHRLIHPLVAATQPFIANRTSYNRFCSLLFSSLPGPVRKKRKVKSSKASQISSRQSFTTAASEAISDNDDDHVQNYKAPENDAPMLIGTIIPALANTFLYHASYPADGRVSFALRSTTTGPLLASQHGITHPQRAALAIALCERWGGLEELPLPMALNTRFSNQGQPQGEDRKFYSTLHAAILTPQESWWAMYIGRIAAVLGEVYPVGFVPGGEERVRIQAQWAGTSKKGSRNLRVILGFGETESQIAQDVYAKAIKGIERVGRRKNWVSKDGTTLRGDSESEYSRKSTKKDKRPASKTSMLNDDLVEDALGKDEAWGVKTEVVIMESGA